MEMVTLFELYEFCNDYFPDEPPGVANLLLTWGFSSSRAELDSYFQGTGFNVKSLTQILETFNRNNINLGELSQFAVRNPLDSKICGRDLLNAILSVEDNTLLLHLRHKGIHERVFRNNIIGNSGALNQFKEMTSESSRRNQLFNFRQKTTSYSHEEDSEVVLPKAEDLDRMLRFLFRKFMSN